MHSSSGYDQLFLFAHCSLAELHQHLRVNCVEEEAARLPELTEAWKQAQAALMELNVNDKADMPPPVKPLHLPVGENRISTELTRTFPHLQTTLNWVDIDTLIAPQRILDLTHAESLKVNWPTLPSASNLQSICLSSESELPIHVAENGPSHFIFSSASRDLRFLGTHVRRVQSDEEWPTNGQARYAIVSLVGLGSPFVAVFRVNDRLILQNGFHRLYALRTLGVREIPAAVQQVQVPQRDLPAKICGISRDLLLQAPRPPLMKDYCDPRLSCRLKGKSKMKAIAIQATVNQQDIAF